jgi:S-adenosylmethionine uptake transporter
MSPPVRAARGIAFAAATFACYSAADAAIKWLTGTYSVIQLTFVTSWIALIPIGLLVWRQGNLARIRPRNPRLIWIRALLLTVDSLCAYFAFSRLPLADTYTIIMAVPLLITALAAPLLGERAGHHRWIAALGGFLGVLLILRPGLTALDIGHLAAGGAALAFATALLITRHLGTRESFGALLLTVFASKIVFTGIALPFLWVPMGWSDWGLMAVAGVLIGSAHISLVEAYRCAPVPVVAPFQYSQLIWAMIFGVLLFGDVPDAFVIGGAALIIACGLYVLWREQGARLGFRIR